MADDVWGWCEKTGGRGRTVTVKIKWADFQQSTRSQSLARPIDSRATLHEASLGLIRTVFPPLKGIRLVGVTLSNFAGQQGSVTPGLSLLPESDAAA
jgi:DNA polymerase-4